jgi:Putative restriction endonuclease
MVGEDRHPDQEGRGHMSSAMNAAARASGPFDVDDGDPRLALGRLVVLHRGTWTEDDYNALPEGVRVELHEGRLILVPDPTSEHQYAAHELTDQLRAAIGNKRLVFGPVDVRMADGRRYRSPDVVVVRTLPRQARGPEQCADGLRNRLTRWRR